MFVCFLQLQNSNSVSLKRMASSVNNNYCYKSNLLVVSLVSRSWLEWGMKTKIPSVSAGQAIALLSACVSIGQVMVLLFTRA